MRHHRLAAGVCLLFLLSGCSGRPSDWKETVPVTGVVYVDGKPAEGVQVIFHPDGGMDKEQPTETKAMSDKEGNFAASTYELADGAPLGSYTLTIEWPKLNTISMTFDGDQLGGKYAKVEKSEWKINVESGKPIDLGQIDLKSKR